MLANANAVFCVDELRFRESPPGPLLDRLEDGLRAYL